MGFALVYPDRRGHNVMRVVRPLPSPPPPPPPLSITDPVLSKSTHEGGGEEIAGVPHDSSRALGGCAL